MKFRSDFVTNSSSSSFVLSFRDEKDIKDFKEYCQTLNYNDFLQLISNFVCDMLYIESYIDKPIQLRPIVKKLLTYKFPQVVLDRLQEIYDKDENLIPNGDICIPLNNVLERDMFDITSINFEDIEEEEYGVFILSNDKHRSFEIAFEEFDRAYTLEFFYDYVNKILPIDKCNGYDEYFKKRDEIKESSEYKKALLEYLSTTDYEEKKKRIEDAILNISATIWDSNGGELEWAIRNGFIENTFKKYCISVYNVG